MTWDFLLQWIPTAATSTALFTDQPASFALCVSSRPSGRSARSEPTEAAHHRRERSKKHEWVNLCISSLTKTPFSDMNPKHWEKHFCFECIGTMQTGMGGTGSWAEIALLHCLLSNCPWKCTTQFFLARLRRQDQSLIPGSGCIYWEISVHFDSRF